MEVYAVDHWQDESECHRGQQYSDNHAHFELYLIRVCKLGRGLQQNVAVLVFRQVDKTA